MHAFWLPDCPYFPIARLGGAVRTPDCDLPIVLPILSTCQIKYRLSYIDQYIISDSWRPCHRPLLISRLPYSQIHVLDIQMAPLSNHLDFSIQKSRSLQLYESMNPDIQVSNHLELQMSQIQESPHSETQSHTAPVTFPALSCFHCEVTYCAQLYHPYSLSRWGVDVLSLADSGD